MMTGSRGRVGGADGEGGSALIIVMMMIAMLGVLTLTLATLSVNNLTGARRAQEAGVALNAADAGLAQAVAYLRGNGVRALECSPRCDGTPGRPNNPWGNSATPAEVPVPGTGGASFKVWVEPAPPPAYNPDVYRVHSSGLAGSLGYRSVTQDVTMAPVNFPKGIFGKSISGGGSSEVISQSMFTTGCVYRRSKIDISGTDLLNNIPAGVHSSRIITDAHGSAVYCPTTTPSIHSAGSCNTTYPYDQDSKGGLLTDTACQGAAGGYPQTSLIANDQDLFSKYNLKSPPLTDGQLDQLKTVAISQGNYRTTSSVGLSPSPDQTNAVMYFDLLNTDPGGTVNLNDITGFGRLPDPNDTAPCAAKSLVIIVDGGNVRLNSNQQLAASVFVLGDDPYGKVQKANGSSTFIGTLYANDIDMTGSAEFHMDNCFKANLSPALLDVQTSNYREVDRVDR